MKKLFAVLIAFALVFAGCDDSANDTTLKIRNESYIGITDVIWNNISFTNNQNKKSISTGTNVSKNVAQGTGYIYFKREGNPIAVRTGDVVTVAENEQKEFVITNNIIIVDVDNTANTDTLGTFYKKPQISVKAAFNAGASEQYKYPVNPNGTFSFSSQLISPSMSSLNITFFIENTGEADLLFIYDVNYPHIDITNASNLSYIFTLSQYPLPSTVIAPNETATFVIRVERLLGINEPSFATVRINTNSQKNSNFSFTVRTGG